jgi:hypothetical protein
VNTVLQFLKLPDELLPVRHRASSETRNGARLKQS